ncbi:T9SS outer membrane translocon Sov/SprA [Nonlabens xiamenensis]|uniref:T9SS outer membrane translocon Sov/SprA n=1 Tax=Nonlabens xiamenensis TaxID=2341043 RepID=UPI000F60BAAB|nr:cell surface protein SprA [Nonlabens xiamenensis]
MRNSILTPRELSFLICLFVLAFAKAQNPTATPQDTTSTPQLGKLTLPDPPSITSLYVYDPQMDRYIFSSTFNGYNIDYPFVLTREQYLDLVTKEQIREYFKEKYAAIAGKTEEDKKKQKDLLPNFYVNSDLFSSIFGGNEIDINPQGSVEVDLGLLFNRSDNPSFSPRNRQNLTFDFNQRINLSLVGKVGTKLQVNANYDTQSTFNFQNQIKLDYTPTEDDILQSIEVGNVAMPLNSQLIRGAQSLFGIKTELQFGKTRITAVFSEQQSESRTVQAAGGATVNDFDFFSLDYDENRHYFLAHYFRDNYDRALENYPFINTNIQITRAEVWITNRGNRTQDVRNLVALQDIGESDPSNIGLDTPPGGFINVPEGSFPDNPNNDFNPEGINGGGQTVLNPQIRETATVQQGFGGVQVNEGVDFVTLENARKLDPQEYTLNTQLGYISLRQRLNNDEVLAVAFQYTVGGRVFQVGEFANDGVVATDVQDNPNPNQPPVSNQNLVVKLLKSNLTNVSEPNWDLMMKNIYNLGGFQLAQEDFRLNIFYQYPPELNYLTASPGTMTNPAVPLPEDVQETTLLRVFNLDRLNQQQDPLPDGDGFFDFIPGLTIDPENGRIIFTTVEPFGRHLFDELDNTPGVGPEDYDQPTTYNANQAQYVYREMYRTTKAQALQNAEKNKYLIKGQYKATGQEGIPIGAFNVPRGSVTVTAGGRTLQEGIDYTVDYNLGRVIILDQALLNSNTPIQVSTENNSVFNQQTKRFTGINVEHTFNEDFILGGTFLNLKERPITQKSTYGFEPINNTILGLNFLYNTEVPFLTRMANKLPNIDTDVPSNLSLRGEVAYLFPGSPEGDNFGGEAAAYVDDFEGSQTTVDILSPFAWTLASTPVAFEGMGSMSNPLAYNFNRAKLAWYSIDPIFYGNQRPDGITDQDVSDYRSRRVFIEEIFPNTDLQQGQQQVINTLDLAYYPDERGPYNYNPQAAGTNILPNPDESWAGITRQFSSTDFEQTNVEYIQFWVMDPFYAEGPENNGNGNNQGGTITLNLGSISEDILKDNRKQYENGLPEDGGDMLTINTAYGKVPANQSLVYAFDTEGQERANQDIGLDGYSDAEENVDFPAFGPIDPAGDNYEFFVAASGDIPTRYKNYNGTEGNSPVEVSQNNRGSTTLPDVEDINRDNTMNTIDSYYEYDVVLQNVNNRMVNEYISDEVIYDDTYPNGNPYSTRWVQFRVPLRQLEANNPNYRVVGNIGDFRAIRFMRMYLSGFEQDTYLRFGALDLVRGDYRQYDGTLRADGGTPSSNTTFEVQGVNIENNSTRQPVPYVLPPGVEREELRTQNQNIRQNEQSLALRVCELQPEDGRAVFKNIRIDMRQYESLKMFVHADNGNLPGMTAADGELEAFVRMGVDFTQNYYEIRLPLEVTAPNTNVRGEVWPEANNFDIDLALLQEIKARVLGDPTLNVNEVNFFDQTTLDPSSAGALNQHQYGIKGNPNFGDIRTLMIGVRNRSLNDVCGEVWFNEMRLAGLKNQGGYAAVMNMDANVADFATVSATGRRSTIGFGAIEQGPQERSRENLTQYDVTTSLSLGQLLPKKWGVSLPFSYSIGEETITPQFDPQFEDIELETRLDNAESDAERDAIREQSENYTKRQSVNLIGVRKDRTGDAKPMPYDIENFTFSGSYNQVDQRNFEVEEFQDQSVNVGGTYNYAFPKAELEPFKNVGFLDNNYLKFIKDLNFNPLPNNFTAGLNVVRQYNTQKFRDLQLDTNPVDLDGDGIPDARNISIAPLTNRNFTMNHQYAINWDLTKSLQLNVSANNDRIIRSYIEDDQSINEDYTLWTDFFDEGVPNTHSQQLQMTYKLPFDKFPFLAFAKANYTYTSNFQWSRNSQQFAQLDGIPELGNTVQNANTHRINGTLDFDKLYTYVGLEKLKFGRTANQDRSRTRSRSRGRLPNANANNGKDQKEEEKKKVPKKNFGNQAYNTLIGLVTAVKRAQINYEETNGIFLPGYTQDIGFIGTLKPTTGFVFGSQAEIRDLAARRGWLTLFQDFNQQYSEVETRKLDYNFKVDLLKDLSIDILGNRAYQETYNENFRIDPDELRYQQLTPNTFGNFSISNMMIRTAFQPSTIDQSDTFETFKDNRLLVANRLAEEFYGNTAFNRDQFGFPEGFSRNSQRVLFPAFVAAYEGRDVQKQDNNVFKDIPLPNWTVKYTGLMNLKWFKKRFRRFSLNHGYRSSYTINRFQTNLDFAPGNGALEYQDQNPQALNQNGDFKASNLYFNINLAEQFSPLVKLDFEMKNSVSIAAEWRKDRAISLSFDNNLLTEINGNELILGLGYRIKDLRFRTSWGGRSRVIKSDLNMRLDGSVRDNVTIVRYLDLDNSQATAGQTIYGLKFSADYNLSQAFTAIFYYDHTFSEFAISTAFPQTTIRSGITLRYTFGN